MKCMRTVGALAIGLSALMGGRSVLACASSDAVYIGTVCATAANFCPKGYVAANGGLLPISQYQALYSLLTTTYGGDGKSTFGVPDLRGRSGIGWGTGTGLSPVAWGQYRGTETVTQTLQQMPSHTHAATGNTTVTLAASQSSGANQPQAGYMLGSGGTGAAAANIYVNPASSGTNVNLGGVTVNNSAITVTNTGGSQSMTNLPPQVGITYCIANDGIYPPRP